jgi:hypothetical protein
MALLPDLVPRRPAGRDAAVVGAMELGRVIGPALAGIVIGLA